MKFKPSNVIWGLCFIAVGILLYCKAFLGFDISLWGLVWRLWPLFIILPCISGMLTKGFRTGTFIWLLIGIVFLLLTNGLVSGSLIRKLIAPVILVLIGLSLIFKDSFSRSRRPSPSANAEYTSQSGAADASGSYGGSSASGGVKNEYNATFGSSQEKYPNEFFYGATINSVFGSITLDLRDAIITEDVVINASVIFAGADIYVPGNVNIKVSSVPIFGGVSNKTMNTQVSGPTIFINATCMFGGLDIK